MNPRAEGMVEFRRRLALALVGLGACGLAFAADGPATTYGVADLPPVHFAGGAIGDDIYNSLRQAPRFTQLDRETVGSPIELRVYRQLHTTKGNRAKGEVTGLLAASTLGLLPVVLSGEHEIVYEYRVNGQLVSRYTYRKAITRSVNMWGGKDDTRGLGKDGLEWARATAAQFLKDSADDKALAALLDEYNEYFPRDARPVPAP
jgi:hypothetical protein